MAETTYPVRRGGLEDLPRVEPLWLAMAAHHWRLLGEAWPPREPEDSWRRRRAAYADWLESLSVAAALRGRGVGGALVDAARELLRAEGVRYWSVTFFEANEDAGRLYERAGFQPFNRQLMGRVDR